MSLDLLCVGHAGPYTDLMNTALCRHFRSSAAAIAERAAGRGQNLVGVDVAHAAMVAEAADGLVAGPAGQFALGLDRAASGLSGAQCHGLVGPKIPTVGVPSAAATCSRPELLDTAAEAAAERQNGVAQVRAGEIAGAGCRRRSPAPGLFRRDRPAPRPRSRRPAAGAPEPRRRRPASASTGRPRRAQAPRSGGLRSGRVGCARRRSRRPALSSSGIGHSGG